MIFITFLILVELGLRSFFGFGNALLYLADPEIGYILAPNQQVSRLGKDIYINQYSMRSSTVTAKPNQGVYRILLLGDSIANSGWWTDQKETISALLERQIKLDPEQKIEVLNASANSWGPRNQLAYLKKFGNFQADMIILLSNTDDLFAAPPTSLVVGVDVNYPALKPPLAIIDLLNKQLNANKEIPGLAEVYAEKGDRVGINLAAIQEIQQIAKEQQIKFIQAITPLRRQVVENQTRDYEKKAITRLEKLAQSENFLLVDFLPYFQQYINPKELYRDTIHINAEGNLLVTETLSKLISN